MDRLRLLTINIWNQWGPWPQRLAVLRQGLIAESPDIVALQEVLRLEQGGMSQLDEVGSELYPHRAYAAAWAIDEASGFTLGNAVLSRLPIVHEERLPPLCIDRDPARAAAAVRHAS
jgi:endonuclease/exonuclease/phosphatase family metal-dependent hydrolase